MAISNARYLATIMLAAALCPWLSLTAAEQSTTDQPQSSAQAKGSPAVADVEDSGKTAPSADAKQVSKEEKKRAPHAVARNKKGSKTDVDATTSAGAEPASEKAGAAASTDSKSGASKPTASSGSATTNASASSAGAPGTTSAAGSTDKTSSEAAAAGTSGGTPSAGAGQSSPVTAGVDSTGSAAAGQTSGTTTTSDKPKTNTKWRPGEELSITTNTEDLVPTDDVVLAKKQVDAYPDSPEASFLLAVALTRTSRVEEALKEVRRARKLAEAKGGTSYFDKMINTYEGMLKNFPEENRVRYGLAWAYYMKAYLLANYSKKVAAWKAVNGDPNQPKDAAGDGKSATNAAASSTTSTASGANAAATGKPTANATAAKPAPPLIPGINLNKSGGLDLAQIATSLTAAAQGGNVAAIKIPSIMDKTDPADVPQIKRYYELALKKLDDLLARNADDVWAQVYRAHLKAEYTGNLDEAMKVWAHCKEKFPNNPASYFFLGEGYLKQGNLKESINNVSRAVALRAMGF